MQNGFHFLQVTLSCYSFRFQAGQITLCVKIQLLNWTNDPFIIRKYSFFDISRQLSDYVYFPKYILIRKIKKWSKSCSWKQESISPKIPKPTWLCFIYFLMNSSWDALPYCSSPDLVNSDISAPCHLANPVCFLFGTKTPKNQRADVCLTIYNSLFSVTLRRFITPLFNVPSSKLPN